MVVKKRRSSSSEICACVGCVILVLLTLLHILIYTHRNADYIRGTTGSTGQHKMARQVVVTPRRVVITSRRVGVSPRVVAGGLVKQTAASESSVQTRIKARNKANQEVKELERSLAKLMRQTSLTPNESYAQLTNERYLRKVQNIILQSEATALSQPGSPYRWTTSRLPNAKQNSSLYQQSATGVDLPLWSADVVSSSSIETSSVSGDSKTGRSQTWQHRLQKDGQDSDVYEDLNMHGQQVSSKNDSTSDHVSGGRAGDVDMVAGAAVPQPEGCPIIPATLVGNTTDVTLNLTLDIAEIVANNSDVSEGGEWQPSSCVSLHRVAVVIPYRDRWDHLKVLLHYLIPVLKRQQVHFRIFVVEQFGNETFNKGRIMNAAFREAMKLFDFHCVTFHDVDLVPEDDRNMYTCTGQPKHMSIAIDKFQYVLPYEGLVGGVLMFKAEHFILVNGYSNMYWGWGAEDDDMTTRILHHGLRIYRPPSNIARYKMVKHDGRKGSEVAIRMKLLRSAAKRSKLEGLNNVQYHLLSTHVEKLFTHLIVDVGQP